MNLAINSRDAMPEGGKLRITVSAPRPEHGLNGEMHEYISLEVTDGGYGMAPHVQARIFEPFFTTKPAGEGTGLGLPIIHGIVQDHNGIIDVKSTPGEGTTVTVLFPRCKPPQETDESGDPIAHAIGRGEVILLAEGKTYVREIMASMLQSLGYKVVQCADEQALSAAWRANGRQARLLIIDEAVKPAGARPATDDGLLEPDTGFVESVRRDGSTIPVVLMVASLHGVEDTVEDRTIVLRKPFQMDELAAAVGRALADTQEQPDDPDANSSTGR
jgi:CheY-like chemotaxis protein